MAFSSPVVIDPVLFGYQPSNDTSSFSMRFGPWNRAGKLYIVLQSADVSHTDLTANVYKSSDGGATWVLLDSHTWLSWSFEACYDGADTITVVTKEQTTFINPTPPMHIIQFDLVTETWGAMSADGPVAYGFGLILPSAAGFLVAFSDPILPDKVIGTSYNGGWGGTFVIAPIGDPYGCVDSTGFFHLFYQDGAGDLIYQQINSTFALSFYTDLGSLTGNLGIPCVVGANIVVPYTVDGGGGDLRLSIAVGAPLATPVFTSYIDIDPASSSEGATMIQSPSAFFDGTTLEVCGIEDANNSGIVRLSSTIDFLTWVFASQTIYTSPGGDNDFIYNPLLMADGLAVTTWDAIAGQTVRSFLRRTISQRFGNSFRCAPTYLDPD